MNSQEENYQDFPGGGYENPAPESYQSDYVGLEDTAQTQDIAVVSNPMFRNAIRWLIYAAAFLVPLWFLPFTADILEFNKQILLIAVAGIGLVLYLVDLIKSGVLRYKPSLLYWPILGLIVAGMVSVIFSVNRMTSLFGSGNSRSLSLITLISVAILFSLAINVIEDRGKMLKKIMTASLALMFLFGVLQMFGLYMFKGTFASRAFNTAGALNALGMLAAMALAFFTPTAQGGVAEEGQKKSWIDTGLEILRYLGLALALFIVILVNWWPVWTVLFISLIALVAFQSASDATLLKKGRMRLFAMPMAVIVLGIFLMLVNFNWTSLKSKFPIEVAPSQKVSWGIVKSAIKARPLGYGAENFAIAYDKFKPASIANTVFYQVRFTDGTSEISNAAVEGGVLMLLAFLALIWFYGKELGGALKRGFSGGLDSSTSWAASLGLLAVYFFYPFNLVILTFFFLLLALSVLAGSDSKEDVMINLESDARYSFLGSVIFIVGLVIVLVGGYFTVNNYMANVFLAKAAQAADRNKTIEYYVESANSNKKDARTYRLLSQAILTQLAEDLKNGPRKDETRENYNTRVQNQIASVVNVSIQATTVDPADSQNWSNRGFIYQNLITLVGGADQAAINTYNESLSRNPSDPLTYLRIGNVYLSLADNMQRAIASGKAGNVASARQQISDNLDKAEDSFQKAINLYNNFGQALYNLAAVYDRQGRVAEAVKQFEKLQASNTRDPSIAFQLGLLYYRNNQKDNAFRAWQQAVFLFPNFSNARWYLSLIYEERGDLVNALVQVREIERFNPNNELVQQRLAQLEAGQRTIPPGKLLDKTPLDQ